MSDVFVGFGLDQRHSFWKSIELRTYLDQRASEQLTLFSNPEFETPAEAEVFRPMTLYEGIVEDYRGLSYSLRGNAMKAVRSENDNIPGRNSVEVKKLPNGAQVTYTGIVMVLQRPPTAKGVAFMTLEDEFGSVDLVLFKNIYERFLHVIRGSRFLTVKGKIERRGTSLSLIVGHVKAFEGEGTGQCKPYSHGQHPRSMGSALEAGDI